MACRHGEFRHTVAYDHAVGVGGLRGADYIAVLVIYQPFAAIGDAGIFPHIEVAERFAFFNTLQVVVGVGVFGAAHVVEILTNVFRVAEIDELVAHHRAYDIEVVCEIFGGHGIETQVKFETGIFHRAHVDKCLVEKVGRY